MTFKKAYLIDLAFGDIPEGFEVIHNKIVDHGRWTVYHEIVFKFQNNFYKTSYGVGATESQCESPYEYEADDIECQQVFPKEKVITVYE